VVGEEDGEIKQVNARFRKLFGLANKKLSDQPDIGQYLATEDRGRILDSAMSALTDFEAAVRRADGSEVWALVSSIRFVFEWAPAILISFQILATGGAQRPNCERSFPASRRSLAKRACWRSSDDRHRWHHRSGQPFRRAVRNGTG